MNGRGSSRREFLVRSASAAAGLLVSGGAAAVGQVTTRESGDRERPQSGPAGNVLGANERINLAVIGIKSRGFALASGFAAIPGVHVRALVDPDQNLFAARVKSLERIQGKAPATEPDLRRVLDEKDIDAVVIATPDHWHAPAAIWACQAGKHVYVEKPVAHNVWEGRQIVAAAAKYGRVVAAGLHSRSLTGVRLALDFIQNGGLGEIYLARGLCYKPRDSIGRVPDSEPPAGVDYGLWLGPAPLRPFNENRFHYNWHWYWDYGSGDIGNQGPHQLDIARWGLGKREHPVKIQSAGGHFQWDDDQETPNTQTATFEYADGKMIVFEVRGLYTGGEEGVKIGNFFFGTKGWMWLNGERWATFFGRKNEPGPTSETYVPAGRVPAGRVPAVLRPASAPAAAAVEKRGDEGEPHFANFIAAVRAGMPAVLTCDIEEGHLSSALPLLANIAYRTGRTLRFVGDAERFVGDAEADRLLRREYRAPFTVPALWPLPRQAIERGRPVGEGVLDPQEAAACAHRRSAPA